MGVGGWFKRRARDAKKAAGKAGGAIEDAAKGAGKGIEKAARETENGLAQLYDEADSRTRGRIMDIIQEAEKIAKKGAREVEGVASKAKRDITGVADRARDEIEGAAKDAKRDVEGAAKAARREAERLPAEAEKIAKQAFDELARAVTKDGLRTVRNIVRVADRKCEQLVAHKPDLVDAINKLGFTVELGPVTMPFSNFYRRSGNILSVLDTYINRPPEFRRGPLLKMIEALGPDSINLGASVQVAALVVSSKELGVGGSFDEMDMALLTELGDAVLEEIGVPE